ncbi:MAG TPA: cell wall hydrolase [Thermohalobaculum sp.]|nr:cell wall hydrolase [Thermohalobaculum sp.]
MIRLSAVFMIAVVFAGLPIFERNGLAQELELDGTLPLTDPLVCLARTIYFEASGQSETEMAAVGHVVMNRVRGSAFPDDICAVIRQGGEAGPCQFSWWCDGRSDVAYDRDEYERVVEVARGILDGKVADPTNGANMFHNLGVTPNWAKRAERRGQIGDQIFYFLEGR